MTRSVTLPYWHENPDGTESFCELEVTVWPPEKETRWEPGHGGYVEPDRLFVDGVEVSLAERARLVDLIIERVPIPAAPSLEDFA